MRNHRPIPLAYFLTYTTYDTWLHGRSPGSVDKAHNQFGTPFLPPGPEVEAEMRRNMSESPFTLDAPRRRITRLTVEEVAKHRGWALFALHVRMTHIHVVVHGEADPDKMLDDLKAYSTCRLKEAGLDRERLRRWTPGGSTRLLWTGEQVLDCVDYVVNRQGEPMEVYRAPEDSSVWQVILGTVSN